ncbi:putative RNA polymerase, sigma-24 subunit, ECF subfamily [Catenulispora acidiphila DSM 44928]|uniref:Putative RNA polymerase, sigma-24 subunit, ECF subfamily n=1 Tax=Catenulispora acidiphila (strain DSM 44928 / JCM 14897 / NBRC 102108 / NRRL B-24433 / ID139908) TaxID=479433 RepID=C7QJX1_CATAD|nr:sigma-70 family RNA polymerase sigma factor [Catenulispora acidiphila]ACU73209.1 putative RNA polymerase, sigma-24 subunit, ECF subfamily [Catenulispora acidiphila DSM 44928]
MRSDQRLEDLLAELRPAVLGALVRRHGQFDGCEDAVQEALVAAATQWPAEGVPDNPRAWLLTVAGRRLTDYWRSDHARRTREATVAAMAAPESAYAPAPDDEERISADDDTLMLLFLCCHPVLSPSSQVALTLRAVGGLTTEEIAQAFLVPQTSMTRRISRAKQQVKDAGLTFRLPPQAERAERTRAVLHVLYLIFNEGYTATAGPDLLRPDLTAEAIRLTRQVHRVLPENGEVEGLLALMLLTEARSPARTLADGTLVPMADQDRSLWNGDLAEEGLALVVEALARPGVGPYRLQAAIAAVHVETPADGTTDWPQILALYDLLEQMAPNAVVRLNRAVAMAMVEGAREGLRLLEPLEQDRWMAGNHRLSAVRAYLLEMDGDRAGAREAYRTAARQAASGPEQRYLREQAERLGA